MLPSAMRVRNAAVRRETQARRSAGRTTPLIAGPPWAWKNAILVERPSDVVLPSAGVSSGQKALRSRLDSGLNFRDLGGYPTSSGGRVRWARVYRSAALHGLTSEDLHTLSGLGLRVVYDLRTDEEHDRSPSVLLDGVHVERLPIGGTAAKTKDLTDLLVQGRLGDVPPDFLFRIYGAMAESSAAAFGQLLTGLAKEDGTPALVHCTAGKDRTGLSAALLLAVLGVDDSSILDDYELSSTFFTERRLSALQAKLSQSNLDIDQYRAVFGAPRHAMAGVLAALRQQYGSIETYLQEEAGVSPEVIDQLRTQLVEVGDRPRPAGVGRG
jgi:protein-tyrosine phosphatase